MPYRDLNPRTELEQAVAADLEAALKKRGAIVKHYGTAEAQAAEKAGLAVLTTSEESTDEAA